MAKLSEEFIKAYKKSSYRKYPLKLGGVVSLKNYWDMIGRNFFSINRDTATVKVEEKEDGTLDLYIDIEFKDGDHEKLPVYSRSLEEDDIVDINSIVVIFMNGANNSTYLKYDALCKVNNKYQNNPKDIRIFIATKCSEVLSRITKTEEANTTFVDLSKVKVSYDPCEDTSDRDIWDAMTDGMYGDYPDEGYEGDYEFMGY